MSAFLFYSIGKRRDIKEKNPDMKNTQISRVLGEMWRSLTDEEREPFVTKERVEREKYKIAIAEWRKNTEKRQAEERKAQAEQAAANMHEQQAYQQQFAGQAVPPQFMYQAAPQAFQAFRKS